MTITHTSAHCITANLNISQEEMGALTRKRHVQDYNECSEQSYLQKSKSWKLSKCQTTVEGTN